MSNLFLYWNNYSHTLYTIYFETKR